jgi:protein dithiol oxidoreductase (disulfide-forming)
MHKRLTGWLAAIALALLATALPAQAQLAAGREYTPIEPAQITDNPAKIEVVEFFSYACPHCSEFNPTVSQWSAKLPVEVSFKRVPISFGRAQWGNLAKLYYALEATGELARHDAAVFEALHAKGLKLYDDKSIFEWVNARGIDSKKFADAYNSFGVVSKVKRGDQMAQSYKISGVPALAVDGKYLVLNEGITGHEDLVARTDKVIDKVRTERGKKK